MKIISKPFFGVVFILAASLINAYLIYPPSITIGLEIYLFDLAFLCVFLIALIRLFFMRRFHKTSVIWYFVGVLLCFSFILGLKQFGASAGVDFRNLFYYWSGTLYFLSFSYSEKDIEKILSLWIFFSTLLLGIVYFRFIAEFLGLGISSAWINSDVTGVPFRVINSAHTYILGVVIIIIFHRFTVLQNTESFRILIVLFIIATIVLQHRSVWAATISGIISFLFLPKIKIGKMIKNLLIITAVGIVLLIPVINSGISSVFIATISESAVKAQDLSQGTFGSRVDGWLSIIAYWSQQEITTQLIGEPFGSGYAGGRVSPHNFVLHNLLRVGALGVLLYIVFYSRVIVKLFYRQKYLEKNVYGSLFFALIIFQVVYYIPYSMLPQHGIILGIAWSLAARKNNTKLSSQQVIT